MTVHLSKFNFPSNLKSYKLPAKKLQANSGIISLLTVMGVGIFALAAALTFATDVLVEANKNKNTVSGDQVFYTAEFHNSEGAYQYIQSQTYGGGTPSQNPNGTISGEIEIIPATWPGDPNGSPYTYSKGISDNPQTHRVSKKVITVFPEGEAFNSAVYAQDDLNIGGNATILGNVFANGDVDFTGASAEVDGDVYSVGEIDANSSNYTGDIIEGVSSIPPPEIDVDPYRVDAIANGTYFILAGAAEAVVQNNTTNGVVMVEDLANETKIQGASTIINGSLVVTGDLELKTGTITATNDYAAVVVLGNLRITGNITVNGVIFVSGETTFSAGTPVINGSLISANGVNSTNITGNVTINYDPNIADTWKNITGLNTTSVSDPVVIEWGEE